METSSLTDWQRLNDFQLGVGLIGMALFVLVPVFGAVLYRLSGASGIKKITSHPYLRFAYACMLKPHDQSSDGGQQTALEGFYSSQVSLQVSFFP